MFAARHAWEERKPETERPLRHASRSTDSILDSLFPLNMALQYHTSDEMSTLGQGNCS